MNKNQIVIEKRQITKLALFSLLASLPAAAGYALVSGGGSVLWAQVENALRSISPQAQAAGETVTHDFPSGWTNNPNWNVIVADCDCPGVDAYGNPTGVVGDGGGDGDDGDGDSDSNN
ncbi:MAG: hypothetical protein WC304_02040 [Candidatus Gracilibacteria bacterium]